MKIPTLKKKKRLIVKNGIRNFVLPFANVAILFIKEKSVFVISKASKNTNFIKSFLKFNGNLKTAFSSGQIAILSVNIYFIKAYTVCESNKLKVEMYVHIPGNFRYH